MRSSLLSIGRSIQSPVRLTSEQAIRNSARSRAYLALLAGFFCLGVYLATDSRLLAQEPDLLPHIEGLQVTWEEVDPEFSVYRFTVSGTAKNWQNLFNPSIEILGYPFESAAAINANGAFSIEYTFAAEDGFGRTIIGVITENGVTVSEDAYTST